MADEETASNERTPIESLPEVTEHANGVASAFPVSLAEAADLDASTGSPDLPDPHGGNRRSRGRGANWVLPVAPATTMIGVISQPLFGDKSVAGGRRQAGRFLTVVFVAPDGKPLARNGLRVTSFLRRSDPAINGTDAEFDPREYPKPVKSTTRVADGDLVIAADKPSRVSLSPQPGRYRLDVKSTEADGPADSIEVHSSMSAGIRIGSADTH